MLCYINFHISTISLDIKAIEALKNYPTIGISLWPLYLTSFSRREMWLLLNATFVSRKVAWFVPITEQFRNFLSCNFTTNFTLFQSRQSFYVPRPYKKKDFRFALIISSSWSRTEATILSPYSRNEARQLLLWYHFISKTSEFYLQHHRSLCS